MVFAKRPFVLKVIRAMRVGRERGNMRCGGVALIISYSMYIIRFIRDVLTGDERGRISGYTPPKDISHVTALT